jgi:hypothetical protein
MVPSSSCAPLARARRERDTEVQHLHLVVPATHQEHVLRLDVSVDDPQAVGAAEGIGDPACDCYALVDSQPRLQQALAKRHTLGPLHGDVRGTSVAGVPVAEVADDVRMLERCQDLGLPAESRAMQRALSQELQRDDLAAEAVSARHAAHAAADQPWIS